MQKILLILSILISCNFCYAQGERSYTVIDFSGGQNSHVSEFNTPYNQSQSCQNVRINRVNSAISSRLPMKLLATLGSSSVNGLYRFYLKDFSSYTLAAGGTNLYYYDSDSGFISLKTGLEEGEFWQFVTYQNTVYGTNGEDNIVKWDGETDTTADTDGARTAGDIATELGAPFAELDTGTNLDASSWYQYKVAFYDGSLYSHSTSRSNPLLTGSSVYNIRLTDVPLGPTGTTHRYIYRTLGNSSRANVLADTTYYLVGTISDNTTTTFSDNVTDATAALDSAPTWSTGSGGTDLSPPTGTLLEVHKERLWISGNEDNPSWIYWSHPFNPEIFDPSTGYEIIREDDGDAVTLMKEFLGTLRIGKENSLINFFTTNSSDSNWYASTPFNFIGCNAQYSTAVTPTGIMYFNKKGVYLFDGQYSVKKSDSITDLVRDVLETSYDEVVGVYFGEEYHMAYTSKSSGELYNNRVIMFDTTRQSWVLDLKNVNSFGVQKSGTDFGTIIAGSSAEDGNVWFLDETGGNLLVSTKSEFDSGTYDDARTIGTEESPVVEISWDIDIDSGSGTIDAGSGIIDRPDTDGTWTSQSYQISASELERLIWNEELNVAGDVTFDVRTDSVTPLTTAWTTGFTDPNGSDISAITPNTYIQLRANLSTSDIDITPNLVEDKGYVVRMTYKKEGSTQETAVVSQWDSGWRDLFLGQDATMYRKEIDRIRVFYNGTSGNLNFNYENDEAYVNYNFDIDLSITENTDTNDDKTYEYIVNGNDKIFTYYPSANYEVSPSSIGNLFRFKLTSEDTDEWIVSKIEIRFNLIEFDDV